MDSFLKRQAAIRLARTDQLAELRKWADNGDPQGCRQLAVALVRAGRIGDVRERMAGGDLYSARALANWLAREKRFDEAIEVMRVVAESGGVGARRRLARLLAGQGHVEEAIAQLERVPEPHRYGKAATWAASQCRFDLLRELAATGDSSAAAQLVYAVERLWDYARFAEAVDLLTDLDPGLPQHDGIDIRMVWTANRWRVRRLHLRDEAIDLLGGTSHPIGRRALAGLLLIQGRYDEAVAELRALIAAGDHVAEERLRVELRRERPVLELRAFEHCAGGFQAVAFSPDGTMLATCDGNNHAIVLWSATCGEHLHTLDTEYLVSALAFSEDGTMLAANGWGRAGLWDTATGDRLREIGTESEYGSGVAFLADGTLLAGETTWSIGTGDPVLVLDPDKPADRFAKRVTAIAVGPGVLATCTERRDKEPMENPTVRLWDSATGERIRDLRIENQRFVEHLAISPDGDLLAAASKSGVWLSGLSSEQIRRIGDEGAHAIAFHPAGHLLATARRNGWVNGGVRLWNPVTGTLVGELDATANSIAFSPDGKLLATADEGSGLVCLWDTARFESQRSGDR
ncbi:WD40 repeat domain-containing protein [Nocardia sp. NPDC056100]|uniref:WD40 repeat domain-containing protein n=1 Tax=Nocardia sp. NPDC056100 TaxID=3345712 RepID=UPI0035E265DB